MNRRQLTEPERALVFAAASLLLRYPDEGLLEQLPLLHRAAGLLPGPSGERLTAFVDSLDSRPLIELQTAYVATFDLKRRNCLYLTYYLNGDTRRRGMALWHFQDAYLSRGLTVTAGELPDFLPVVLELAACGHEDLALALILEHRHGIEVLQQSLAETLSPYADVIAALVAALPQPTPAILAAAETLAKDGPPAEQVGLEPFFPMDSLGVRT
ncbi:MAG TPA: nitrate reductase molybdenum cofactor assembly chaperone [Actinomycetes bacterium]